MGSALDKAQAIWLAPLPLGNNPTSRENFPPLFDITSTLKLLRPRGVSFLLVRPICSPASKQKPAW